MCACQTEQKHHGQTREDVFLCIPPLYHTAVSYTHLQLAPLIRELCSHTRLPVIAKPNAGMPDPLTGAYDMGPAAFAKAMLPCLEAGASILGGCCGTDPAYIQALAQSTAGKLPAPRPAPTDTCYLCAPSVALPLDRVRVIGERINPTGKKRFPVSYTHLDVYKRQGISAR